jgi:hypothetical protein
MLDYLHVRASDVCPLCCRHKGPGLVVCWSCYHARGMRYGNKEAEELLEQTESRLCGEVGSRADGCEPERL